VASSVASAKACHSRPIVAELMKRFLAPDNARSIRFVERSRCRSPSVTVATLIFTQGSLRQWIPPLDLPDEASTAVRLAMKVLALHATASSAAGVTARGSDVHNCGYDGFTAGDAKSKRCSDDESR
jgi:hypothetical protein